MDEKQFKFKVKIGGFEFEVEGDRNFVEKTMTRYEGRFLPRFHQMMDSMQRAALVQAGAQGQTEAPQKTQQATFSQPTPPPQPAPQPVARQQANTQAQRPLPEVKTNPVESNRYEGRRDQRDQGDKRDRNRRPRGGRKYQRNGSTWVKPAPLLPKDQELIRDSYVPTNEDQETHPVGEDSPVIQEHVSQEIAEQKPAAEQKDNTKHADTEGLKQMFDKLNPRTHHEKILAFAYYLNTKKNQPDFMSNDVKDCYNAISAAPPGNINGALNHACRTGFLSKHLAGRLIKYALMSKGRHFVERGFDMNDRESNGTPSNTGNSEQSE